MRTIPKATLVSEGFKGGDRDLEKIYRVVEIKNAPYITSIDPSKSENQLFRVGDYLHEGHLKNLRCEYAIREEKGKK